MYCVCEFVAYIEVAKQARLLLQTVRLAPPWHKQKNSITAPIIDPSPFTLPPLLIRRGSESAHTHTHTIFRGGKRRKRERART